MRGKELFKVNSIILICSIHSKLPIKASERSPSGLFNFNPFLANIPRKPKVFWCFQEVENRIIDEKWVEFSRGQSSVFVVNFEQLIASYVVSR